MHLTLDTNRLSDLAEEGPQLLFAADAVYRYAQHPIPILGQADAVDTSAGSTGAGHLPTLDLVRLARRASAIDSESALCKDWLKPEEDEAWRDL
jgi:hypothetical protein